MFVHELKIKKKLFKNSCSRIYILHRKFNLIKGFVNYCIFQKSSLFKKTNFRKISKEILIYFEEINIVLTVF